MKSRWWSTAQTCRRGAALLIVLMSLAVLFSLGVPFLFASRMRSEAANETYDRSRARIAVDSASKVTAFHEALTHPSIDPTPLWDSVSEWDGSVLGVLPQSLGEDWEGSTESWGAEIESVQASVSFATAPPMLLQNLIHPCFLTADAAHGDAELQVTSTEGFPDTGLLWIGSRWVTYGGREGGKFTQVLQDPEAPEDLDQTRFRRGFEVQDPRVQALALSRFQSGSHQGPEFFGDILNFSFGTAAGEILPELDKQTLQSYATLSAGAYGAAQWEPAGWLVRAIDPEHPEIIVVNDGSLFNAGTVLRLIPEDGLESDVIDRLVLVARGGGVVLSAPVPTWFTPFRTRIHALRREPIDINACRPEVLQALATGVAFQGAPPVVTDLTTSGSRVREWVSPAEARSFAERVMQMRPLHGPEDLWSRVLAPLAEEGGLTDIDAWALYVNGMDPNSGTLRQSTTSYGYRSGNTFQHRINAAIRSRLGRTLARAAYRERIHAAPSGLLMSLANTQETFEDFGRWARGMHGVTTLPNAVGTFTQAFGMPITAPTLQMGTLQRPGLMYPETDHEVSAVIPTPARESDTFPNSGEGVTEHFDYEPSPLGRRINEIGPHNRPLNDWRVGDGAGISNVEPLHFQGWFKADTLSAGHLIDLSGFQTDRNRVSVALEGNELVVRCWGTTGEDPGDLGGFQEAIIQRLDFTEYALADRWFHVSVTLRNQSARGMQVCIDGVPRGEIDGFTYLTQAMDAWSAAPGGEILVENTEGFPDYGVLRIGNELVDYSAKTSTSFILDLDPARFIGGRSLREATEALALFSGTSHPEGAGVELYGYSALLLNNMMIGGHNLSGDIGPWSIATAITGPETLTGIWPPLMIPLQAGVGIGSQYVGPLELSPVLDFAPGDDHYAKAFQVDGGYAVIFQSTFGANVVNADDGSRFGGWEIIRYSSRDDTSINIVERQVTTPGISAAPDGLFDPDGASFVMDFEDGMTVVGTNIAADDDPRFNVYVVPISVKASGASVASYLAGTDTRSQIVQISDPDDPGSTEWIRYDHILDGGYFVRDDWAALSASLFTLFTDNGDPAFEAGSGGPSPSMDAPSSGASAAESAAPIDPTAPTAARAEVDQQQSPWATRPVIGVPEDKEDWIQARALDFQFRGVMGTFDHEHKAGESAVPVFTTLRPNSSPQSPSTIPGEGYVGRLDRVAVLEGGANPTPFWYTVQWATPARENPGYGSGVILEPRATYIAFEDPGLFQEGPDMDTLMSHPSLYSDWREITRISKFPNQERPANLANFVIGGDTSGAAPEFDGLVDEVSLHTVGGMGIPQAANARAAMILTAEFDSGFQGQIQVHPGQLSLDGRRWNSPGTQTGTYLGFLPQSGILDVDGERIAYNQINTGTGEITIAPGGRGLMGTEARAHGVGTRVWIVDGRAAIAINGGMGISSEILPVSSTAGFSVSGMVLIDQELIHVPMRGQGFLGMPRSRDRDQAQGQDDPSMGLLRGRFGTDPAAHADGAVAISFPNRWMDNYIPRADSGAGSWLQMSFEEPQALWQSLRYEAEVPDNSMSVRALVRSGFATWEDDPRRTPGLLEFDRGRSSNGGAQKIGFRSDRLDLRIMFDWGVGSFDPTTFEAKAWTMEPRLRNLMVDYYANSRVERSQEVVE